MFKYFTIALVTLSFNLAPVAQAQHAASKDAAKVEKVETKTETKTETKADAKAGVTQESCEHCKKHDGKGGHECACKDHKDCKCSKADCDSGECTKKGSKKFCKHCAEHKDHAKDEHKDEKKAE